MSAGKGKPGGGKSGSFGGRLLVILFALAVVAIGMEPINKEHGSVLSFIRQKMNSISLTSTPPKGARARLGSELPKEEDKSMWKIFTTPSKDSSATARPKADPKVAGTDNLSVQDRKALDQLINDL